MFKLVYDEKTGTWGKKKGLYTTIEVATEEDFKHLNEKSTFLPDYCCFCRQKIDWSDIRNDKL